MLLTDGCPNTTEDLRVYESSILDVASTESIDLKTKLGLAAEEVSDDVLNVLLSNEGASDPVTGLRRLKGVSDVVVTRQLKRWHAVHTLAVVYRDAFHNQLNDRYQAKYDAYQAQAQGAREQTLKFGVGLALNPVPRAEQPVLSSAAVSVPGATFYVQVSWVAAGGAEGAPSELTTYEAQPGTVPVVQAVNPPDVATGFNVYMGLAAGELALQNAAPIATTESFTLPTTGLVAGRAPGDGQTPDVYVTGARVVLRG